MIPTRPNWTRARLQLNRLVEAALLGVRGAVAREPDELDRSARLLSLTRVLAEGGEVLTRFLPLAAVAFDADVALVVLDRGQSPVTVTNGGPGSASRLTLPAQVRYNTRPMLLERDLPNGWTRGIVAPLEADGIYLGSLLVATSARRPRLSRRDLTLLTPLASALATTLAGAEHLDRLLTEQAELLHAVVRQSGDGILVLDGGGLVQLWNPALEEITGVPASTALGRRLRDIAALPTPDIGIAPGPLTPAEPTCVTEVELTHVDGERRRLRCTHSATFQAGALERDVVTIRDLTRERRVERLKGDFIATVSHELRTPLTPIAGYIDLLRTRGNRMTPQKRYDCLELLAERTAHLSRLVEDLLLVSRIDGSERGPVYDVAIGSVDLRALLEQAAANFDPSRLRVRTPAMPVGVRCDPLRATQVLTNLVGNALKYSAADREVTVDVQVNRGRVSVSVCDRGQGIPRDELERVFEKFHRVEDARTSTSGSGLGLYIARRLARAMDGDVTVCSRLGVGSTFTLTLPCSTEASQPAPDDRVTAGVSS